jgi:hypothetical protein
MSCALRARRVLVLGDERVHIGDHASLLTTSAMYRDLVGYWTGMPTTCPTGPRIGSRPRSGPDVGWQAGRFAVQNPT